MACPAMMFTCKCSIFPCDECGLVARAQKRDPEAFADLVNQYRRKIFRLAKRVTQNDEDAEDVLQETFLKAYEHLDSFQGKSKFFTWIVRIAMNEALMKLRKRRSHRTISLDEPPDAVNQIVNREIAACDINPEQQYSKSELSGILERALESLRPKCRTVFILRDVEELSIEQTAETLGISVPAVKSRLLRARLMLRERLAHHGKSPRTMARSVLPG